MRWIYSLVFIAIAAVFAGGCSSTRVHSDQVQGTNFSAYKTYAWLPNGRDSTDNRNTIWSSEITQQNIRSAADREMKARGFTLDASNPELLLMVHTDFERKEAVVSRPFYSSYNYYHPGFYTGAWFPGFYSGYYNVPYVYGYGIEQIEYTEGTVVIDAIDRQKNQLVWRGWSEETLYDYDDVNELYGNVDNIFKRFPMKEKRR